MPDCREHSEKKSSKGLQPVWQGPDGTPLSCREKIRLLEEGLTEFQTMAQDLMEDALLMGVDENQIKEALVTAAHTVNNPYEGRLDLGSLDSGSQVSGSLGHPTQTGHED